MKHSDAISVLSALAHDGRLAIFRLLVRAGKQGLPAGEISRKLDILPNTLSASLTVLANANLVSSKKKGRSVIYAANYVRMTRLMGFLIEDCCNGSPEICGPLAKIAARAACC